MKNDSKRFRRMLAAFVVTLTATAIATAAQKKNAQGKTKIQQAEESVALRPFGLDAAKKFAKQMTVADGYEATVFAAEPLLRKPSNLDVDEYGRVWVAEIANYGSSRKPWGVVDPKGDRIMILADTNHDGVADKSTMFYQGRDIDSPYGVCVVGNKTYVGRSPDMYAFTDLNGDGHADKKEMLFTQIGGFDSDHCAHTFVFGPDGKLYFNFGNHSGQLKTPDGKFAVDAEGYPISVSGKKIPGLPKITAYRDGLTFRCNPDGSELEVLAYNFRNPFEVCFDSFGTLFQSDNDDDGNRGTRVVYLMEHGNFGYVDEMTGAGWREPRSNLEKDIPHRHWHQNDPGVVPNLLFTGAGAPCGMTVYEGDLMPELRGALLHCDAGPREVRAYFLSKDGAGYKATSKILMTTDDSWFRPSDVCVGPDGAIYVADWHDGMVGGHDFADRDLQRMHGRIYRIAPKGFKPFVPTFDFATAKGCIEALKSPNLAARARAWEKLHDLGGAAENDLLELWRSQNPRWRARALQLLARIPARAEKYLNEAARDSDSDVRLTTLRVARTIKADVIPFIKILAHDSSAQVRRECALSLRHNHSADAPKLWAELAVQHEGEDRWYLEALGIGADKNEDKFFQAWMELTGGEWNTPAGRDIIWRSRATRTPNYLAQIILDTNTPDSERPRYFRAFDFNNGPEKKNALVELMNDAFAASSKLSEAQRYEIATESLSRLKEADIEANPILHAAVLKLVEQTRGTAKFVELAKKFQLQNENTALLKIAIANPGSDFGVEAARLILANPDSDLFQRTLDGSNVDDAIRTAEVLGHVAEKQTVPLLLPVLGDDHRDIGLRKQSVRALAQTSDGARQLLQLAKANKLSEDLKLTASKELNNVRWAKIKAEAAKILPLPIAENAQALPPLSELLKLEGDPIGGEKIFNRAAPGCFNCHQVNGKGAQIGPDLSEIGAKFGRDAIIEAILDPNAGIAPGFEAYSLELKSGDEAYGLLVSDSAGEVAIKDLKGIVTRYKRSEIASRHQLKNSLMPAGLQQSMTAQEFVDLIAFLSSLKKQ